MIFLILLFISVGFYHFCIRPFIKLYKEEKDYREYIKTITIINSFIYSDEFKNLNLHESERVRMMIAYLDIIGRLNKDNYKEINIEAKNIFKDVIPEFKSIDRENKLKDLLK